MGKTTAAFAFATMTALATACSSQREAATPTQARADSVPAGTEFTVRLNDAIGTTTSATGEYFTASVVTPVRTSAGKMVGPEGAVLRGRVVGVERGQAASL